MTHPSPETTGLSLRGSMRRSGKIKRTRKREGWGFLFFSHFFHFKAWLQRSGVICLCLFSGSCDASVWAPRAGVSFKPALVKSFQQRQLSQQLLIFGLEVINGGHGRWEGGRKANRQVEKCKREGKKIQPSNRNFFVQVETSSFGDKGFRSELLF